MTLSVNGARILVTGASAGIGWTTAQMLAQKGATICVTGRRAERLEELLATLDGDGHVALAGDLASPEAARELALKAWAELGHLDVVVHNAAIPKRRALRDLTFADVEETMAVNFFSPVQMTLATLPLMHEQGTPAVHVYVGSTGGRVGIGHESAYCASKFALSGWAETIAIDLGGTNVDVRIVQPGPIDTEIWDRPGSEDPIFNGPKEPPSVVSEAIIAAIEQPGFERYAPDMSAMVNWHVDHLDEYISTMSTGIKAAEEART